MLEFWHRFARGVAETPMSVFITDTSWIVPAVQSVHILAICMLMGSVLMTELSLAGLAGRAHTLRQNANRYVPWVWGALVVLLLSGLLMIIGEPVRELANRTFWIKMTLILIAALPTAGFQALVQYRADRLEVGVGRKALAALGALVLLIWVLVCVAGRFIAYSDYPTD